MTTTCHLFVQQSPLWSLSYEIFFYLVFPLVMIGWRRSIIVTRWSVPVVAVAAYGSYLAFPNHFSLVTAYFLMWWAGAIAAHLYIRDELRVGKAVPEFVGLAALTLAAGAGVVIYGAAGLGYFPVLILRHCLTVLILFAVLFTPIRRMLAALSFTIAAPAAAVAGVSYGLYVVHYPVMVQTGANDSWWIVPAIAVTIALAWAADKWVPSILPRAPKS